MLQTLQKKPRVMLTAPSNVAVAQMASRCPPPPPLHSLRHF